MGQILCVKKVPFRKSGHICRVNEATSSQLKILCASATSKESHQEVFSIQKQHQSDNPKPHCDKYVNQHYCHQPCPAQGVECYNCG